ncbi:LacI family transcriptional regulator [Actinomadura sp. NBRC 104425]|uniref:LacI family DNA-binding transcriptional regulator n=1 Tax=Actinomadura sp. NBRC 104425 TaxID=3032204 RepID=UPI0024A39E1F|nr:LacI family DNA-binding transcriptional regulator [Actinomadura sp. NBRC 104425]GLZ11682.1 LacI family transcriptional regulator [Actinomadura sp. NBRC 104425]
MGEKLDATGSDAPQAAAGASEPAKRPTMRDVAARAGVSKALVSLVFRNAPGASAETRARVMQAAAELGYRHNRTASLLARRRTHLLGVTMTLRNTFHAELFEELQAVADEFGYELALSTVTRTHDERRAIENLLEFRCEGLVLIGAELPAPRLTALGRQLPVVVVGRRIASPDLDVVRTADDQGVGQVVDHLAELGHRSIAHLDGGAGTIASDRRRGYRKAMQRNGLEEHIRLVTGGYTEDAGMAAARALLDGPDLPTAVVAVNDRSAVGLLDILARSGVEAPKAVSVAGYDDSPLSRLAHVNLTTVSQEPLDQARHALQAMVERLDGGRTTRRDVVLKPRLVIRGTTGAPR